LIQTRLNQMILDWQSTQGRNLTHQQIADATGLSLNFIHRFRAGDLVGVKLAKLGALCDFFKCTPNDLLWVPDPEVPATGDQVSTPVPVLN